MQDQPNPRLEIALGLFLIIFSIIIFLGTRSLPAPKFEPLGSAAVPATLAGIIAILSVVMVVRAALRLRDEQAVPSDKDAAKPARHPILAAVVFGLTVLFVAAMDLGLANFRTAGIVYVTAVGFVLHHAQWKHLPWVFGFAVVIVLASEQIFTRLFYIDLP